MPRGDRFSRNLHDGEAGFVQNTAARAPFDLPPNIYWSWRQALSRAREEPDIVVANRRGMNSSNSFGYMLVGVVLVMWPMLAPEGFPPTGFDGTSTRALWLEVMGAAQMAIGIATLLQTWVHRLAGRLPTVQYSKLNRSTVPVRLPVDEMAVE